MDITCNEELLRCAQIEQNVLINGIRIYIYGQIKGATWGLIWHTHHTAVTAGSVLPESGVYIFNHEGVYC